MYRFVGKGVEKSGLELRSGSWSRRDSKIKTGVVSVSAYLLFFLLSFVYGSVVLKAPVPETSAVPIKKTASPSLSASFLNQAVAVTEYSPNGEVIVGSLDISTTTDSPSGYNVKLNTPDDNTCMRHYSVMDQDCDSASVGDKKLTAGNLVGNNQWAWSGNGGATWTVPQGDAGTDRIFNLAAGPYADDNRTVEFGMKANTDVVAGNYRASVVATIVPNYIATPTITGVYLTNTSTNASGYTTNETVIDIEGTSFDTVYEVYIDLNGNGVQDSGEQCFSPGIVGGTKITCTTPTHTTAQARNVVVSAWGGSATKVNGFTYTLPIPVITRVSPDNGHFIGGETVVITGANFTGATVVRLGTSHCRKYSIDSDSQITCITSGEATVQSTNVAMSVASKATSVNVTNSYGTNAANTLFTYRYPDSSNTDHGTFLHILGADIQYGSKLMVGEDECHGLVLTGSSTTTTCTAPPKTAGSRAVVAVAPPIPSTPTYMQNWTGCSAIATPNYTTTDWAPYTRILKDSRDGKNYRVRKLPDGKCWMIDDLKLGGTGSSLVLTSADSNVTSSFVLPANPITAAANRVTNGLCESTQVSASGTGGELTCDGTTTVVGLDSNENYNFSAYVDPASTSNATMYENCFPGAIGMSLESLNGCGYLYNWYTATAGTGVYAVTADNTTNTYAVSDSICPAGWRLPKAGAGGTVGNELASLNGAMYNGGPAITTSNADTKRRFQSSGPFSGSFSGTWLGGVYSFQGESGGYWTASASTSFMAARRLNIGYSQLSTGGNSSDYKYRGASVRCVL